MRFHNPHSYAIGPFTAGKDSYHVPAGGDVEIPDLLAFIVPKRGLGLVCKDPERLAVMLEKQRPPAPKDCSVDTVPVEEDEDGEAHEPADDVTIDEPEAHEASSAIDEAVRQLEAQGVQIPSVKRRGRKAKAKG